MMRVCVGGEPPTRTNFLLEYTVERILDTCEAELSACIMEVYVLKGKITNKFWFL